MKFQRRKQNITKIAPGAPKHSSDIALALALHPNLVVFEACFLVLDESKFLAPRVENMPDSSLVVQGGTVIENPPRRRDYY